MKKVSTLFLKAVLVIMALSVLALCIFAFPSMGRGIAAEFPAVKYLKYFVLVGYLASIPFLVGLYQAFKLLGFIDKNVAFSEQSTKTLRIMKYCGVFICISLLLGMPFVFWIAEVDDAPGAILIWMVIACSPIVVSVFAAVLEKLIQNGLDLKSENELTV